MGLIKIFGFIAALSIHYTDVPAATNQNIEPKTYAILCGEEIYEYKAYRRMKPENICELAKELADHDNKIIKDGI